MKVTVNEKPSEKVYPYLGKARDTGCVVLFYKPNEGTCLEKGLSGREVGDYDNHWSENWFVYFTGEIVLSNS